MATLDELLDAVAAAPPGPQVAAFFDYDGTVIDGFSASAFYRHRIRHAEIGPIPDSAFIELFARGALRAGWDAWGHKSGASS